jgi:hypothetical protein
MRHVFPHQKRTPASTTGRHRLFSAPYIYTASQTDHVACCQYMAQHLLIEIVATANDGRTTEQWRSSRQINLISQR